MEGDKVRAITVVNNADFILRHLSPRGIVHDLDIERVKATVTHGSRAVNSLNHDRNGTLGGASFVGARAIHNAVLSLCVLEVLVSSLGGGHGVAALSEPNFNLLWAKFLEVRCDHLDLCRRDVRTGSICECIFALAEREADSGRGILESHALDDDLCPTIDRAYDRRAARDRIRRADDHRNVERVHIVVHLVSPATNQHHARILRVVNHERVLSCWRSLSLNAR